MTEQTVRKTWQWSGFFGHDIFIYFVRPKFDIEAVIRKAKRKRNGK